MREAEALAVRLGDESRLGWVLADLSARLRNVLGEHRQAVEVGRRALAIATERGDHALALAATYRTGQAHFALGEYARAIELFEQSRTSADEPPSTGSTRLFASWSHAWLAMALSSLGRFVAALSHVTEAIHIAEAMDHPFTLVEALTAHGGVLLMRGDLERAITTLERALALSREWKFKTWATLSRLGYAYALSARLPEAWQLLDEVTAADTTVSSMGVGQSMQVAWLGEACALDHRLDDAQQRAEHALAIAREHEERGDEAWAHRLLGEIAMRRSDLASLRETEDHLRRALARVEEARESLASATAMYREIEMQTWLTWAEKELRDARF
jgi:tetratricopeptide (TPR) repeat protein